MQISQLLLPRDTPCVECNTAPPPCACQPGFQCVQSVQYVHPSFLPCFLDSPSLPNHRSCVACSTFTCIAPSSSHSGSGGVSSGAVAGAVIAVVLFVVAAAAGFFYWRRRQHAKIAAEKAKAAEPKDVPAPADTVLRRPDPSEKPAPPSPRLLALAQAAQATQQQAQHEPSTVRVYDNGTSVIDLDPQGEAHGGQSRSSHNPFNDGQSILTTSTGSQQTNVIPIALVPPGTVSPVHSSAHRDSVHTTSTGASSLVPPQALGGHHSPINMDHLNVSRDSSVGDVVPRRASGGSYVTNASYASDLDAVIVTSSSRHVLGVGHASAVTTPLASAIPRTPGRSPLSATAFAAAADESMDRDPFGDAHTARSSLATFGGASAISHAHTSPPQSPQQLHYTPDVAGRAVRERERPISSVTQAASVIGAEVVGAARVQLNYTSPTPTPVSPAFNGGRRMTAARFVASPQSQTHARLDVQAARARAQQALERRPSMSTMASGMSSTARGGTDADSILEAFPFVPPSPIAGRPPRSPPANAPPPSPLAPPDRRAMLGMSVGSEMSNASTGLGSFPFEIDAGSGHGHGHDAASANGNGNVHGNGNGNGGGGGRRVPGVGRVRASLDTLALTSDLASYPLGFDRGDLDVPPTPRR
jgi:hypothetical protein